MKLISCLGLSLLASASAAMAQDNLPRLDLACVGAGSANKLGGGHVAAWDGSGNTAQAQINSIRSVGFADEVVLSVGGEAARIRMPRSMLPPIHGGDDGWFKIKSIKITEREITGSIAVSAINNPKLRIDRFTGAISLSGKSGDYTGRCTKYDPTTQQRAF